MQIFKQIECFKLRGIKFTVDPLFPLVGLILYWQYFAAGQFLVGIAGLVSLIFIITAHEVGHALMALWCKTKVSSINLHWFGGSCEYIASNNIHHQALISAGGVLVQGIVLVLAMMTKVFVGPIGLAGAIAFYTLIQTNLLIIVFNLLPIPNFDGHKLLAYAKTRFWSSPV